MPRGPRKQKIIQKRVLRRERFVRMAKLRHRDKVKNEIAKVEILSDIEKCTGDCTSVHQYSPGIFVGERDGRIDCDISMLNSNHLTNCISVLEEGNVKLVQVKLCKNATQVKSPSKDVLESWRKNKNPSWGEWVDRFEKFSVTYKNFLMKHEQKFKTGKLDIESINRYNEYVKLRNKLMTTGHCVEVKTRFNLEEDYVSEITRNSIAIANLDYSVDEYVEKILKEGIPRVKYDNDDGFLMRSMMDNFETLFERSLKFVDKGNITLMGKDQQLKDVQVYVMGSGYFIKKRAEISYLYVCEDFKPLIKEEIESLTIPVLKEESLDLSNRKAFLDKYYKVEADELNSGMKEEPIISKKEESIPVKMETETVNIDINLKEEMPISDTSVDSHPNITLGNLQSQNNGIHPSPFEQTQASYGVLLNSYMSLLQNNFSK